MLYTFENFEQNAEARKIQVRLFLDFISMYVAQCDRIYLNSLENFHRKLWSAVYK